MKASTRSKAKRAALTIAKLLQEDGGALALANALRDESDLVGGIPGTALEESADAMTKAWFELERNQQRAERVARMTEPQRCSDCGGGGRDGGMNCPTCGGTGYEPGT